MPLHPGALDEAERFEAERAEANLANLLQASIDTLLPPEPSLYPQTVQAVRDGARAHVLHMLSIGEALANEVGRPGTGHGGRRTVGAESETADRKFRACADVLADAGFKYAPSYLRQIRDTAWAFRDFGAASPAILNSTWTALLEARSNPTVLVALADHGPVSKRQVRAALGRDETPTEADLDEEVEERWRAVAEALMDNPEEMAEILPPEVELAVLTRAASDVNLLVSIIEESGPARLAMQSALDIARAPRVHPSTAPTPVQRAGLEPVFSPTVELARLTSAEVSLRRFLNTVNAYSVTPDERGVIAQRCRAIAAEVADLALYVGHQRFGFPSEIYELVGSILNADVPIPWMPDHVSFVPPPPGERPDSRQIDDLHGRPRLASDIQP